MTSPVQTNILCKDTLTSTSSVSTDGTLLFRTQKKSNSVPNSATLKQIEERIVNAIKNKGKDAKKSRQLAWDALQNEGYRVAMVLVVRFGNGLRTRATGGGYFFENFNASGSSKSSLVVMLGRA